jgi:hypothetical protein
MLVAVSFTGEKIGEALGSGDEIVSPSSGIPVQVRQLAQHGTFGALVRLLILDLDVPIADTAGARPNPARSPSGAEAAPGRSSSRIFISRQTQAKPRHCCSRRARPVSTSKMLRSPYARRARNSRNSSSSR